MILPYDVNPSNSLYYIGGIIISILKEQVLSLEELFVTLKKKIKVSYLNMIYSLDWLFLIDVISYDGRKVKLCL